MKARLSAVWHGVVAGLTSHEAVKAERSLVAMVAVRLVVSFGGTATTAAVIYKVIHG